MIKKIFLVAVVLLPGCASLCGNRELSVQIECKDRKIRELSGQLVQKELELKARDETIRELKSRLQNFGVF